MKHARNAISGQKRLIRTEKWGILLFSRNRQGEEETRPAP